MTAEQCAHCGRIGHVFAHIGDSAICHSDEAPDCYRLVTIYREPLGSRIIRGIA